MVLFFVLIYFIMSIKKNTYIYLLSNIINAMVPFALLPILTRTLSPAEYGAIAMFQILIAGLGALIGANTVGAANRKFYDNVTEKELVAYNSSCFIVLGVSTLIVIVFSFVLSSNIVEVLSIPEHWIFYAILVSLSVFIITFRLGQWQIRNKASRYAIIQVGSTSINMGMTLFLVVYMSQGADGRVEGWTIASLLFGLISYISLKKDKLISLTEAKKSDIKSALSYGVPLAPHIFGVFLLSSVDRFIINDALGLGEAGIYMIGVQVSMALSIIFDAINKAYTPWLFETLKRNEKKSKIKIVKATYMYFFVLLFLSFVAFKLAPFFIALVVGEQYWGVNEVIGWLCLGQIFGGMYLMVTNYVFYSKKTGYLSLVTIGSGIINVLITLTLVESYGIKGAAMAFALSKLIQFILTWLLSMRCVRMPWLLLGRGYYAD